MPLSCNSPTRSGNQPVIDAIRTTNLGTDQPPHPDGSRTYSPRRARPSAAFHSHRDRGHIAAAHSDASTTPRFDSLDTMSGPAAIASPNPAAVACEIDKIQTKINHPAGLKPTASKNSPEEQTHPTCPPPSVQPHRHPTLRQPTQRFRWNSRTDTTRGFLALPDYTPPPRLRTPVPRETGQRTRVTHKSPPALNTDQAMNLFRDKTIKLLNRTMRTA